VPIVGKKRAAALMAAVLVVPVLGLGAATGCSLVVESQDRQCEADADCSSFEDAVCDVAGGVCVSRLAGCLGPDGCFSCPPAAQAEFLNACTDAECIPYDNTPLLGLLQEDGSVPPVP
jgi:hypothetical protein